MSHPSADGRAEGFTVIELIVVVLVIGVVATIAIPSFVGLGERGHDAAARTGVRSMSRIHAAGQEEGRQPATIAELETAGLERSSGIEYGLCAEAAGTEAVFAARVVGGDVVWLVDGDGLLVDVVAADVATALLARDECPGVDAVDTAD